MWLEFVGTDGKAQSVEVGSVRIVTDQGTVIGVATEWSPGQIYIAKADDPEFNRVLRNLGIDRTTIVRELTQQQLKL